MSRPNWVTSYQRLPSFRKRKSDHEPTILTTSTRANEQQSLVFAIECSWSRVLVLNVFRCYVSKDESILVFTALALQPLNFLAVAVDFILVAVDLLLLLVIGILLALQLVTNQRTCA